MLIRKMLYTGFTHITLILFILSNAIFILGSLRMPRAPRMSVTERGPQMLRVASRSRTCKKLRSDAGKQIGTTLRNVQKAERRPGIVQKRGWQIGVAVIVSLFLAACGSTTDSLDLELSSVSSSQLKWHSRLLATIENPRYPSASLDPKKLAATGDLYRYARDLNNNLTSLMLAYRETGDRDLVRHLNDIMNVAKGKLRDTNGDGYRNWLYLTKTDASSAPYIGTDKHVMDEMMTHSLVAAAAYTLKQAGYSSSASFWTSYLKNDFEAKWRKRNGKSSGFPFLEHFLMHPTTNFIRYNFYMYKLTGQSSYYSEAKRLASRVRGTMRSSGSGYVWPHAVSRTSGCQPMVYVKYTTQALADIATADSSLFDSTFMKKVAYTMAYKVLKSSDGSSMAGNACGSGSYGSLYIYAQHPYAQLAAWDSSGKLKAAAERVYSATERYSMESPKTSNVAAQMVFTLGR